MVRRITMTVHKVEKLKNVDPTRYMEGDVFISDKGSAQLLNGKMEPIVTQTDLKQYVKKSDVKKMIADAVEKAVKSDA